MGQAPKVKIKRTSGGIKIVGLKIKDGDVEKVINGDKKEYIIRDKSR